MGIDDVADQVRRTTIDLARAGGDVQRAAIEVLHLAGQNRPVVEMARERCEIDLRESPDDTGLLRAVDLLNKVLASGVVDLPRRTADGRR